MSHEDLRFLVVASDSLGQRFDPSLPKKLAREVATLAKAVKKANRAGFAYEDDTRAAASRMLALLKLHTGTVETTCVQERVKRDRPGRPRKDEVLETRSVWRLSIELYVDNAQVTAARHRASCLVLVSNWTTKEWDDVRLLSEYRRPYLVEGHTGFRWLKGPASVAPVFLKSPQRIRAMGLVLILALVVRNCILGRLRTDLAAQNATLPHPFTKKADAKPTTEMTFEHFSELLTQVVILGEESRRMPMNSQRPSRGCSSCLGWTEASSLLVSANSEVDLLQPRKCEIQPSRCGETPSPACFWSGLTALPAGHERSRRPPRAPPEGVRHLAVMRRTHPPG